jgi:hypothetical protein
MNKEISPLPIGARRNIMFAVMTLALFVWLVLIYSKRKILLTDCR